MVRVFVGVSIGVLVGVLVGVRIRVSLLVGVRAVVALLVGVLQPSFTGVSQLMAGRSGGLLDISGVGANAHFKPPSTPNDSRSVL